MLHLIQYFQGKLIYRKEFDVIYIYIYIYIYHIPCCEIKQRETLKSFRILLQNKTILLLQHLRCLMCQIIIIVTIGLLLKNKARNWQNSDIAKNALAFEQYKNYLKLIYKHFHILVKAIFL